MSHGAETDDSSVEAHSLPVWLVVVALCVAGGAVGLSSRAKHREAEATIGAEPAADSSPSDPPPIAIRDYYIDEDTRPIEATPEAGVETGAKTVEAVPGQEYLDAAQDPAVVAKGKELFKVRCEECHGPQAQGNMGPNLCDEYWIHGHSPVDIHRSIDLGNPKAGMVPWGTLLPEDEIKALTAFVISLRGSNPPLPKAPEGKKRED